jgi:4-hydroxy-tetrahydrodipicolinate synthase
MITKQKMTGLWAGLPVAWERNMAFDEEVYRSNVERTCKAGVSGVYTAGTTGEFYAMEWDEWKAITKATVEECKKNRTPVMIGVTSTYTLGAIRRANYAAEVGADAIQVALPFWMELDDRQVVPFFKQVSDAAPELGLTIYETMRSKKSLTADQHRAVSQATGRYLAVKATANTIGCTPDGCRELSSFVNVWVNEMEWSNLGPYGATGCASALVYVNPPVILHMLTLLRQKNWKELKPWTDMVTRLVTQGLDPYIKKGFTDTAFDHLMGVATGFLTMNVRSRGPYISATDDDVQQLRAWMKVNTPVLLDLNFKK